MEQPVSPLARLGRAVAKTQDEVLAASDITLTPARLREAAPAPQARRWSGAIVALAAALAIAFMGLSLSRRQLAFEIGAAALQGEVGGWIAAPAEMALPLRFSDGTRLVLAAGSTARVASVAETGAQVVLERGRIEAEVIHRDGAKWSIGVGPFEVKVTGTRFTAAWDPGSETLELTLHEGSVVVTGPTLGCGREVRGGEALRVSARPVSALDATPQALETPTEAPPSVAPPPRPREAPSASAPAPAARASWRALATSARYVEALAAAEEDGFDALCESSSAEDLLTLGDAARLAGSSSRAKQAYVALRRRSPGDRRAGAAAFVLGRMAFDGAGAYAEAARWFTMYLAEQPRGALAREAAGRLLEAHERAGDRAAAVAAAKSYLSSYPEGPHAAKASSLLTE